MQGRHPFLALVVIKRGQKIGGNLLPIPAFDVIEDIQLDRRID